MSFDRITARTYGKRGGARRKVEMTYMVEGEHVTTAQMAARIGIEVTTAQKRLRKAQSAEGPVTWAALGLTE